MLVVAVVAVVAACEQAALVEALVSAEVECVPAALVVLACVQLASTGVGLQAIASRMPVSRAEPTSVFQVDLATGLAGVGVEVAGAAVAGAAVAGPAIAGPAIAGAGVEAGAAGVGAQPR
jgi:hypothetical protein